MGPDTFWASGPRRANFASLLPNVNVIQLTCLYQTRNSPLRLEPEMLASDATTSLSSVRLSRAKRLIGLKPGVGSHRVSLPKESDKLSDKLQNMQTLVLCFNSVSLLLESSEIGVELEACCKP